MGEGKEKSCTFAFPNDGRGVRGKSSLKQMERAANIQVDSFEEIEAGLRTDKKQS